jgi:hypothetical protein
MALILRKCKKDGSSRNGFVYGQAGDTVTAPNWDPKPECGNGLHGLKQGNGDWDLLHGVDWLVIEANDEDTVDIDNEKCKFRTGKILYRGDVEGLHQYASVMATNSRSAFCWARDIGDHEIMKERVIESEWAFNWAINFGDHEIMRDRVTESKWAYYWAIYSGDKEIMRDRVTDSEYAYWWAFEIGDREIMIDRVNKSSSAFAWACNVGDRDIMRDRVTDSQFAFYWAKYFGDKEIMRDRITEPFWKEEFNQLPS